MRITRQDLLNQIDRINEARGFVGDIHKVAGAVRLDSANGGYSLEEWGVPHASGQGVRVLFGRTTARELYAFMRGMLTELEG